VKRFPVKPHRAIHWIGAFGLIAASCAQLAWGASSGTTPEEVVAVIESVTEGALIDHMEDGSDIAWTSVTLSVVSPERLAGVKVATHCSGNPIIDGHKLAVGDRVQFVLPVHPELKQIFLYHLERLRLANSYTPPDRVLSTNEIETADYRVEMPAPIFARRAEAVQTPWGNATTEVFFTRDQSGITYIFSTFAFKASRVLAPNKLREVKAYFLRNHKCVARDLHEPPLRTADGQAWPQASFGGNCAAPGDYRITALIAQGKLYQLQVTNDPQVLTNEPPENETNQRPPMPAAQELGKALEWFFNHCEFKAQPRR